MRENSRINRPVTRWAEAYRRLGYNPLPSRLDAKRPLVKFAEYWDQPFPRSQFDRWAPDCNIQLMTGRRWGLLVVDVDGPEAFDEFWTWRQSPGRAVNTWVTRSEGWGCHYWFSVPRTYPVEIRKRVVWKGQDDHSAIEIFCDRSLVIAPPSIHPKTGAAYQFKSGYSPREIGRPQQVPRWMLDLPSITPPVPQSSYRPPKHTPKTVTSRGRKINTRDLLERITDKPALARSWGLRLHGRANPRGWFECHAIDREDRHPSAGFHQETGYYCEPGQQISHSLFDLAVALGVYLDRQDAITDMADKYLV